MKNNGFIATTSIVIMCMSVLAFQYVTWVLLLNYTDMVYRMEQRVEARARVESCFTSTKLILEKDYFFEGKTNIREFDCTIDVTRNHATHTATVRAQAQVGTISSDIFEKNIDVF